MDLGKVIAYVLIGMAVTLVINYMNKGASQEIEKGLNGEVELRMNKFYQTLGYVSIGIALIFILIALYYQETEMYIIGVLMLLLFGGLGLFCLMYYRNHRLNFNDEKIIVHNWRRKIEEISWGEIDEIKFNPFSGYIKVRGLNKNLRIHQHLVGLKEFTESMEKKTKWKASKLKLPSK